MNQPKHYVDREVRYRDKTLAYFCTICNSILGDPKLFYYATLTICDDCEKKQNAMPLEIGYKVFPLEGDE